MIGLSPWRVKELAARYIEQADALRRGVQIDQQALEQRLHRMLADVGVLTDGPETEIEAKRVREAIWT